MYSLFDEDVNRNQYGLDVKKQSGNDEGECETAPDHRIPKTATALLTWLPALSQIDQSLNSALNSVCFIISD